MDRRNIFLSAFARSGVGFSEEGIPCWADTIVRGSNSAGWTDDLLMGNRLAAKMNRYSDDKSVWLERR
jgi:hypothetical protein